MAVFLFTVFFLFHCLSKGAFGKVYSGTIMISGTKTIVAIKTIKSKATITKANCIII